MTVLGIYKTVPFHGTRQSYSAMSHVDLKFWKEKVKKINIYIYIIKK